MSHPRGRHEPAIDDYHDTGRPQPGHENARPSATTAIERTGTGNETASKETVPPTNGPHQAIGETMFKPQSTANAPEGFEPHQTEIAHADGSWTTDTHAAPDWWNGPAIDRPGIAVSTTWHPNSGVLLTGPDGERIEAAELPTMARQLLELYAAVRAAEQHAPVPGVTDLEHEQSATGNGGDR